MKQGCGAAPPPGGRQALVGARLKPMPSHKFLYPSTPSPTPILGYRRVGKGPTPVIALHDWRGDHRCYRPAIPVMDRRRFMHVLADVRGYGLSAELRGAHTVEEIADDVLALADNLSFEKFHLVGHSLTALAAERLAALAPERIYSVAFLAPFQFQGESLLRFPLRRISDHLEDRRHRRSRRVRGTAVIAPAPPADTRSAYLENASALRQHVNVETPPALLMIGDRDPLIDARRLLEPLRGRPQLSVIPNVGHFLLDDDPVRCMRTLQAFHSAHTP